jgi:hypothetical protein
MREDRIRCQGAELTRTQLRASSAYLFILTQTIHSNHTAMSMIPRVRGWT